MSNELITKYSLISDKVKKIVNDCSLNDCSGNELNSIIKLLEILEEGDIKINNTNVSYEKKILELIDSENSILTEYEHLKTNILIISDGIVNVLENCGLPILLNIFMDGINAYNNMIMKYQYPKNNSLELSLWSIELMDKIHATNGGNTTLLEYTLKKIQDQNPSILNVFDDINYVERISNNCKIDEIYRGIMRLNFSLESRTKSIINLIDCEKSIQGIYTCDNVYIKIEYLNEMLFFLKCEFLHLIKDVIFFSRYLGLSNFSNETLTNETILRIKKILDYSKKGPNIEELESVNSFLSELDIPEYDKVLEIFNLLNWLSGRVRNMENNKEVSFPSLNGNKKTK